MEKKKLRISKTVLITGLCLMILAGVLSPANQSSVEHSLKDSRRNEIRTPEENDQRERRGAQPKDGAQENILTPDQGKVYFELFDSMKQNDLAKAASVLAENETMLSNMLEKTLNNKRYFYNENGITDVLEGRGLVLESASTLFYGNFLNGKPEGNVIALKEMVLEEPRYDYSIGLWKQGKMNGAGTSGYTYYERIGEIDGLKTEKTGFFQDDLMEGELRYICIDNSGNSITWKMTALAGVTVIDERWEYRETDGEYHLPAENADSHVYTLKEKDVKNSLWKNRLRWENNRE